MSVDHPNQLKNKYQFMLVETFMKFYYKYATNYEIVKKKKSKQQRKILNLFNEENVLINTTKSNFLQYFVD